MDAGTALPDTDQGQYIEEKGSGGCAFETSKVTLKVEDGTNHVVIGQVDVAEETTTGIWTRTPTRT